MGLLLRGVEELTVARITELAKERDRNAEFGESAIRDAENVGAREALKRDVIEYIAEDVDGLLAASAGATVKPKGYTLKLKGAELERMEMTWPLRILKRIVDPNLLFLLFGAGVLGLAFEITHPGSIFPGMVGGISFLIALFGLSVLPATGTGIALLVLATALFAAEAIAPGGGLLGGGGAIALLLGALLLFDDDSGYGVSPVLAVGMALAFGLFFVVVVQKALQARRLRQTTGGDSMIGLIGSTRAAIAAGETGTVYVDGELWRGRAQQPIAADIPVRVTGIQGLLIDVEPVTGETDEGTVT